MNQHCNLTKRLVGIKNRHLLRLGPSSAIAMAEDIWRTDNRRLFWFFPPLALSANSEPTIRLYSGDKN